MTGEDWRASLAADLRALWSALTDLTRRVDRLEHDPTEEKP